MIGRAVFVSYTIKFELNYVDASIEAVGDFNTVWVKIGEKHDCKFEDLPFASMALVADKIINL